MIEMRLELKSFYFSPSPIEPLKKLLTLIGNSKKNHPFFIIFIKYNILFEFNKCNDKRCILNVYFLIEFTYIKNLLLNNKSNYNKI